MKVFVLLVSFFHVTPEGIPQIQEAYPVEFYTTERSCEYALETDSMDAPQRFDLISTSPYTYEYVDNDGDTYHYVGECIEVPKGHR